MSKTMRDSIREANNKIDAITSSFLKKGIKNAQIQAIRKFIKV